MQDCICTCALPQIKQGDACSIQVHLFFNGQEIGAGLVPMLEEIEFAFEDLEPVRIPAREAWNDTLGCFLLPVMQEQTFLLEEGRAALDVRVRFLGGGVLGAREKRELKVADANSGEVLE